MEEYEEQHEQGIIMLENMPETSVVRGDLGVQIAKDGRVWICINGIAFLRFSPHKDGKMKKE